MTCAKDGCLKMTSLSNLEQVAEVYKPRRGANAMGSSVGFSLVAFGDEVYIYPSFREMGGSSMGEVASLGSFKMDGNVVSIGSIPQTDNFFLLTQHQLTLAFIDSW